METVNLKGDEGKAIEKTAEVIKAGGLVIYPTDTVYILAVDPTNQKAVDKLIGFKDRWPGKAISVAVKDINMANEYVEISGRTKKMMNQLLPGPFTLVIDGKHKMATGIEAENGTLGIRIPENVWISKLVEAVGGPVTATSANLSGRTPHYSVESLLKTLPKAKKEMIDLVADAGKLPNNKPSTVIDISTPEIKVLRRGDLMIGETEKLVSKSEKETEKIAEFLWNKSLSAIAASPFDKGEKNKAVVFGLSGDLGCGKTVFSRALGKLLGVKEKITSPTFVIYNEYLTDPPRSHWMTFVKFLHFDLYRISNNYEFEEIKFLDQFSSAGSEQVVACIEWPENMGTEILEKLKEKVNYFPVNFEYKDETTREISYKS